MWPVGVAKFRRYGYLRLDMLKNPREMVFFSRMPRAATAESILIRFATSTPWADIVIYLKRHPNWSKGLAGEGCKISTIPLTLPLASNTAYCATAHSRDTAFHLWGQISQNPHKRRYFHHSPGGVTGQRNKWNWYPQKNDLVVKMAPIIKQNNNF